MNEKPLTETQTETSVRWKMFFLLFDSFFLPLSFAVHSFVLSTHRSHFFFFSASFSFICSHASESATVYEHVPKIPLSCAESCPSVHRLRPPKSVQTQKRIPAHTLRIRCKHFSPFTAIPNQFSSFDKFNSENFPCGIRITNCGNQNEFMTSLYEFVATWGKFIVYSCSWSARKNPFYHATQRKFIRIEVYFPFNRQIEAAIFHPQPSTIISAQRLNL